MPVRVIDLLESIEIEEHDGQRPVMAPGERYRVRQPIVEEVTIGQSGHGIVQGPSSGMSFFFLRNREGRLRIRKNFPGFGQRDLGLCEVGDPLGQGFGHFLEVVSAFLHLAFNGRAGPQ